MVSKKVAEKIRYLEAKTRYERILRENKALNEYATTGLFKVIGDALGDIFKSLKLSAMDISNELKFLGSQLLFLGNPARLKKSKDNYNRKRDKILSEWEPIVKKNMDALKNADALLTLSLAPSLYLATQGVRAGVAAGKTAAEIIAAEDWQSIRSKINKFGTSTPDNPNAGTELGIGAVYDQMKQQGNILAQLNDLFTSQSKKAKNESRILEQDDKSEKIDDPEEWLATLFELTGINLEFSDTANEILENKIEMMSEMIPLINSANAVSRVVKSDNLEDFEKLISEISNQQEIPRDTLENLKKIVEEIENQAKQVATSEEFANELSSSLEVELDTLSQDDLLNAAKKAVFQQAKSNFDKNQQKPLKDATEEIEETKKDLQLDKETLNLIKTRKDLPNASEFLKVYDSYMKAYKELDSMT